jgi:hypothetical protein
MIESHESMKLAAPPPAVIWVGLHAWSWAWAGTYGGISLDGTLASGVQAPELPPELVPLLLPEVELDVVPELDPLPVLDPPVEPDVLPELELVLDPVPPPVLELGPEPEPGPELDVAPELVVTPELEDADASSLAPPSWPDEATTPPQAVASAARTRIAREAEPGSLGMAVGRMLTAARRRVKATGTRRAGQGPVPQMTLRTPSGVLHAVRPTPPSA